MQSKAKQSNAKQSEAMQSKAMQGKASKAKQTKAKQCKTRQSRAKKFTTRNAFNNVFNISLKKNIISNWGRAGFIFFENHAIIIILLKISKLLRNSWVLSRLRMPLGWLRGSYWIPKQSVAWTGAARARVPWRNRVLLKRLLHLSHEFVVSEIGILRRVPGLWAGSLGPLEPGSWAPKP